MSTRGGAETGAATSPRADGHGGLLSAATRDRDGAPAVRAPRRPGPAERGERDMAGTESAAAGAARPPRLPRAAARGVREGLSPGGGAVSGCARGRRRGRAACGGSDAAILRAVPALRRDWRRP